MDDEGAYRLIRQLGVPLFTSPLCLLLCACVSGILVWECVLYLCGSIGVDGDHVFNSLFDFELDVELSLKGGDAFLVGWRTTLCPGRLRTFICGGREKVGDDIKRNKTRVHMVWSKVKTLSGEFHVMSNVDMYMLIFWIMGTDLNNSLVWSRYL